MQFRLFEYAFALGIRLSEKGTHPKNKAYSKGKILLHPFGLFSVTTYSKSNLFINLGKHTKKGQELK
jgi:hypothetical protein